MNPPTLTKKIKNKTHHIQDGIDLHVKENPGEVLMVSNRSAQSELFIAFGQIQVL